MARSYEMDMCSGPLPGKILRFAIPLMLSSILQLLFNAADVIVVGRFAGSTSLAAVGSTGALINLLTNVFLGLSIGTNVLVARYFGARQEKNIQETIHTSMMLALIGGGILVVLGLLLARPLLELMGTPEDVLDKAALYMRIIFVGCPAMMIYNFGSAVLRAVGDTKRPLYYLTVAGILNIVLNLFFVIVFHMDVAGVALATIISQAVSAVCIVVCMAKNKGFFRLSFKQLRFYGKEAGEIVRIGLPAGVQSAIFSLSNVLIQSSVNSLGTVTMDGNGASSSIEGFVYAAMNSVAQACLAFVSANFAVGNWRNIKKVALYTTLLVLIFGLSGGILVAVFGRQLLAIYVGNPDAIQVGYSRLILISLTYFTCGLMDVFAYSLRGMGYSLTPTIVSLCGVCGVRIIWIYTFSPCRSCTICRDLPFPTPFRG